MADLFSILSQASWSLGTQRDAAATASQNIANASTPGYARQEANIESLPGVQYGPAFIGQGATLASVTQIRDRFIESQIPGATGAQASSTAQSDALSSVSALDPSAASGLSSSLAAIYAGLRGLSAAPGDAALRGQAVSSAQALASSFKSTVSQLQSARSGLDSQVQGNLAEVNQLAQSLAAFNGQIRAARASGAQPNDLLDARLRVRDRLVELTGGTPLDDQGGDTQLTLAGGATLVSGNRAATLSTQPDPSNEGHAQLVLKGLDGSPAKALRSGAVGGAIGGALAARDGALATSEAGVDQLAFNFAAQVNAVHQSGYALDGTTGHALFDAGATAAGAASRLTVTAAVLANPSLFAAASSAATVPGDGANLLALIGTEDAAMASGSSAGAALSTLTAQFGSAAQSAKAMSAQDSALRSHLDTLRESASGVSIDEETVKLTQAQRAFEAVSKVVSTADGMLQSLFAIT